MQGKYEEAVAKFREVIRIKPDDAAAHGGLGFALGRQKKYPEGLSELLRAAELAEPGSPLATTVEGLIREFEEQIALTGRLTAILNGEDQPQSQAERLAFAQMAYDSKHYAGAARLWTEALEADPKLADDRQAQHLYNAACAATLAAAGAGIDEPQPNEAERARLRTQALAWLQAEKAAWAKFIEDALSTKQKELATMALSHWKTDRDLASVRGPEALEKLPEAERGGWQSLWAEVDNLLGDAARLPTSP
jgi:tetratricopeptide (TPR) repeat protein